MVFKVYDLDHTGAISKEEFTKMLYNFPKEEIQKFFQKIFGEGDAAGASKPINDRFQSELYESIANFNYRFDPNKGIDNDASISVANVESQSSSQHSISSTDRSTNDKKGKRSGTKLREDEDGPLAADLQPLARPRKNSYFEKLRRHKVLPTNVSNQIAIWCDSIYEQYGTGNKLYFKQFVEWASIHKNFIFTFARYFRYTMWKTLKNPITNKEYLGFHKMTPVLQEAIQIRFVHDTAFRPALACLYIEFLFLWFDRSRNVPNEIKILRDVGITFQDETLEVHIAHYSPEYPNFTIRLARKAVYLYWREILTNYSRWPHQRPSHQSLRVPP